MTSSRSVLPIRLALHFSIAFALVFALWLTGLQPVQTLIAVFALIGESWGFLVLFAAVVILPVLIAQAVATGDIGKVRSASFAIAAELAGGLFGARIAIEKFPAEWW